jgi:hypothetical protein
MAVSRTHRYAIDPADGHSTAGHSVTKGRIVLDLGDMKARDIVADRRTARSRRDGPNSDDVRHDGRRDVADELLALAFSVDGRRR